MKLISWNVNGIRAAVAKTFWEALEELKPDVLCIQETKAQDDQVKEALDSLNGYHLYSNSAVRKGYSGTAVLSKTKPISIVNDIGIEEHDTEGRVITVEYEKFYLVNVYVPNSGSGMKRLDYRGEWDIAFAGYLSGLRAKKPVIVTGDFNVAHSEIDLARPTQNYNKTSGYTQKEIDGMDLILSKGFVDSYRMIYPEKVQYSFWSARFNARANNVGWRVDYFLVDEKLKNKIKEVFILDQIMGSDHCPIGLKLDI